MTMKRPLLVLAGPTAVGKTAIGIKLAQHLHTEIISADSRQIYKLMDVGTAKPSFPEKKLIPHHMIDLVYPDELFNAARYNQEARIIIEKKQNQGHLPFMVGGCGLYIKAITQGIFEGPGPQPELRKSLLCEAKEKGTSFLFERLSSIDPTASTKIHPNDLFRIIRALEVYYFTGVPISSFRSNKALYPAPYDTLIIGLSRDRRELYNRIEDRCKKMVETGLIDEVKNLLKMGFKEDAFAFKGPAYTQAIEYLRGMYSLDRALYLMQRETKRFAKRQFTWFRQIPNIIWFHLDGNKPNAEDQTLEKIIELVQKWLN